MGNKDASILVMIMDVLTEKVRKESMVLADDVVLCRGNPIYRIIERSAGRVSRQKTQWMHVSSSKLIERNL